jgi:hypothetical protein
VKNTLARIATARQMTDGTGKFEAKGSRHNRLFISGNVVLQT